MNIEGEHLSGSTIVRVSVANPPSTEATDAVFDAAHPDRFTRLLHRKVAHRPRRTHLLNTSASDPVLRTNRYHDLRACRHLQQITQPATYVGIDGSPQY